MRGGARGDRWKEAGQVKTPAAGQEDGRKEPAAGQEDRRNEVVDHFFQGHALRLYTPLELSFSASKLRNMDALSKSHLMLVVYRTKAGRLEEIDRTEAILNSLEALWITKIIINYHFEILQPLVFRIYDIDTNYDNTIPEAVQDKMLNLAQQDFLGEAFCNLSEIVTKFNHNLTLNLQNGSGHAVEGTISVCAKETASSRMAVEMQFHCLNLDNKDAFSKTNPFLTVSRLSGSVAGIPICKTEVINNNLNPVSKPITLTAQKYSSKDDPLLVECFDFNASGHHLLIGALKTSIADLEILYESKAGANFYSHKGQLGEQLFLDKFQKKVQHTFLDYISSGFELKLMVAVDCTESNGAPKDLKSLHHIDPSGIPNSYEEAFVRVSNVLEFYDNDKKFPAWGFGAKIRGSVSHCFDLNAYDARQLSETNGVAGILAAYLSTIGRANVPNSGISFEQPILLEPVISKAAGIASHSVQEGNNQYFVLLIITNGVTEDKQEIKDSIVRASDLPLSILIVGVGNANFTQMKTLDAGSGNRLQSSKGRVAARDIVKFVSMREFQGVTFVQSLLEELPGQFLEYMRINDIKPRPPQHASAPSA